jgi:hypothetical protein
LSIAWLETSAQHPGIVVAGCPQSRGGNVVDSDVTTQLLEVGE